MSWWNRLANLIRSERLSKHIDRELAFHIEERVDELVASGMDESAARREAVRQFGEPVRQRERTRDADVLVWLETVVADVRHAWRALRGNPAFALVAILSLALGIGANTAIFSLIDALLLESLPVHRPAELVRIGKNEDVTHVTNPIWEQLRDRQDFFTGVFAYTTHTRFNLAPGGEVRMAPGSWVSGDYFTTLGVGAALGRVLAREDDAPGCPAVAVLSHSFWRSEYGENPGVVGRSVSLNRHAHTIIGVAAPGFTGLAVGQPVHVFAPLCAREIHQKGVLSLRSSWNLRVMARAGDGMSLDHVRARLAAIAPAVYATTVPTDWGVELQREYLTYTLDAEPAPKGDELLREHYKQPLFALMVVVGIVLLIACVNVANLLLARAAVRRRELAIRLAIGVSRARLLRQLLTESLLLAGLGAIVGLIFAHWSSRLLVGLLSSGSVPVHLDLSVNGRMLGFTILVAVLTGLLFGLAPAWGAMRLAPHGVMKATDRGTAERRSGFYAGKALVAVQVALSLMLLVGAGLFMGTFQKLTSLDAGFDRDGVLLVDVNVPSETVQPDQRSGVYRDLLDRFRALPGVRSASASQTTPLGGNTWNNWISVDDYSPTSRDDALVYLNEVSDGYFATLRSALIAGRDFDQSDVAGSQRVALINRTMARKYFGDADPIGREFRVQFPGEPGPPTRIIGVVEDAKYESLREATVPTASLSLRQNAWPGSSLTYELRSRGAPEMLMQGVKEVVEQVHPSISLEIHTLQAQIASSLARERVLALLSSFFGVLALLLCVIGLYGTLSYSVARRRKEIGVRLALGAAPARVLRMVLGEAGMIVLAGLVIGVIAALASKRLISSFLYGLSATDPTTIVAAAVVLTVVTFAASALPAWRAANTDALIPLREE